MWSWLEQYAPDEFRYRVRTEPVVREVDDAKRALLRELVGILEREPAIGENALGEHMKRLAAGADLKPFYPVVYDLLIGRDRGPKLTTLLATLGGARALPLLRPSLA